MELVRGGKIKAGKMLLVLIVIAIAAGGVGYIIISRPGISGPETPGTPTPGAGGLTVSGYVKDNSGNPISGATVYLGGMAGLSTTTDSSGHYEFKVAEEERDFDLIVVKAGYNTATSTVHVSTEPVQQDVQMSPEVQEPVTVKFTLTVPYTQANDIFSIKFGGNEPVSMQQVNDVTWFYLKDANEGDVLSYRYVENGSVVGSEQSVTAAKRERISATQDMPDWPNVQEQGYQWVFDAIPYSQSNLPENFRCSVGLFDLWGINFNWIGLENTSDYVGSSLDRAKQEFNAEWVMLTTFLQWDEVDPLPKMSTISPGLKILYTVTEDEMTTFVEAAHSRNMKVMLLFNGVPNYEQEGWETWADTLDETKSTEWLDAMYVEYTSILENEAAKAEAAGVDAIQTWLHDTQWNQGDDYDYTSEKFRNLIDNIREVYSGDVVYDVYDILAVGETSSLDRLTFWDAVDFLCVEVSSFSLATDNTPSISALQSVFESLLSQRIEPTATQYGKGVMLHAQFPSYDGALRYGWVEPGLPGGYPNLVRDWQEQADGYEALFRAIEGEDYVTGLITYGYWWDGAMDPFDTKMSPSVGHSVRGKLAEAVLSKWCGG